LDSNVFGLKKSLFHFGPFWGRSRRIPGRLSSSVMQLGPRRTKYAKLRKRNHAKRTQGRRDLDLIFPVLGSRVRSRLRVGFFPAQSGHKYCQKLGSCSHLWVSRYRRWFSNQGVPGSNPGGDLFFPKFRGVSPGAFWRIFHSVSCLRFLVVRDIVEYWGVFARFFCESPPFRPNRPSSSKLAKSRHFRFFRLRRILKAAFRPIFGL